MMERLEERVGVGYDSATIGANVSYLNILLGTDFPKKLQELAKRIQQGIANPSEITQFISLISDAQVKLTYTNAQQMNTFGRLLGWVHNFFELLRLLYEHYVALNQTLKQYENDEALKEEGKRSKEMLQTALNDLSNLIFRVLNNIVFWINLLPSYQGKAFEKLTTQTRVVHQTTETKAESNKKRFLW